jgi:hypothetical protein
LVDGVVRVEVGVLEENDEIPVFVQGKRHLVPEIAVLRRG